jgi:hypothetical protein
MNLQEQIGALDAGVDQLIQAASVAQASRTVAAPEPTHAAEVAAPEVAPQQTDAAADTPAVVSDDAGEVASDVVPDLAPDASHAEAAQPEDAAEPAQEAEAPKATLEVGRPSQNEITMTIGGQTVSLHPMQIGELIEQLANARASMQPEPPPGIPPGWRFVSTKNPMMAVQKQSNGDRLLVMRHTGHGWIPFTFTPDMVVQMYMMLTQR